MSRTFLLTALATLLVLSALPASAGAGVSATATRDGSTASVEGSATFVTAEGPIDVGGNVTDFASNEVADAAGIRLTKAELEMTDDGVRFIWHVNNLPDTFLPEGARLTWSFLAGGESYQLQAKTSNLATVTTTEDPIGHATQATEGTVFQLRGACTTNYRHENVPLSGCYHLAFLDGSFNPSSNTVTIDMPFNTTDDIGRVVAQSFQPGSLIEPNEVAGTSVAAGFQAVASTSTTGSFINAWDAIYTGPIVEGFIGEPDQKNPNFGQPWQTLELNGDGSFSGTLNGASPRNNTVHLRACNLDTCATTAVAL